MFKLLRFKRKPNKLFLLYFLSFFLVILVPVLLLSLSSYQLAYKSIVKEIRSADYNAIQQTASSLDRLLGDLATLSVQLGLDGRIYAASENEQSSFMLNDAKDRITNLSNENAYVQSIQLYFFNSNLILSSDGPDRKAPGLPQDQWIQDMQASKQSMVWLPTRSFVNHDGNRYNISTVAIGLPVAFPEKTGYVAIHFYEDKLNAYLREMDPDRNSMVFLAEPDEHIISSYTSSTQNDSISLERLLKLSKNGDEAYTEQIGSEYMVTVSKKLRNDWRLISVTPLDYVEAKMSYVRHVILLTGLLLVAFGAAISFFLSRTMYSPIKALVNKIKRHQKEFSLPDHLAQGQSLRDAVSIVDQVFVRHRELESLYRTNYEGMVERFLYQLFFNRSNLSEEDLEKKIADLALPLTTNGYCVMLIEIDDYAKWKEHYSPSDWNLLRYATKNIAHEIVKDVFPCLSAETDDHQTAVLINIGSFVHGSEGDLSEAAEAIVQAVRAYLPFTVTVSFGAQVGHIRQSHISFRQAQETMRHKMVLNTASVLYPEQVSQRDIFDYFYPAHLERALINHLRAGDYDETKECLEKMRDELMNKPHLSYENVYRLYNRLIDATIDMVDDTGATWSEVYGAGSVYKELTKQDSIESIHLWMSDVLLKIGKVMQTLNRPPSKVEAALAFISARYQEDISVEQIADEVQLNAAYLSRIFKQTVGKTVLEHITFVRMAESKRLLTATSLTIQEIASCVGYNNTTSFIRSFRKHEGITPGEYRRIHS